MNQLSNCYEYDAFISYRHTPYDIEIAKRLQFLLENYKPPHISHELKRKRIKRVFLDQSELPTSDDLAQDIRNALDHSEYLIIICSEAFNESKWCAAEIAYFKEKNQGKTNKILVLLVQGDPTIVFPNSIRYEEREILLDDGVIQKEKIEHEPLAANVTALSLREAKRKLKKEFLRIAAPILGCSFDELYQRQRRRQVQHISLILLSSFMLVLVFGYFTMDKVRNLRAKTILNYIDNAQLCLETNDRMTAAAIVQTLLAQYPSAKSTYRSQIEPLFYQLDYQKKYLPYARLSHTNQVIAYKFICNNQYLAASSEDNHIRVWDVKNGELLFDFISSNIANFIDDDENRLCFINLNGMIEVWDLGSGELLQTIASFSDMIPQEKNYLNTMEFDYYNDKVLIADCYGKLWSINLQSGLVKKLELTFDKLYVDNTNHYAVGINEFANYGYVEIGIYDINCEQISKVKADLPLVYDTIAGYTYCKNTGEVMALVNLNYGSDISVLYFDIWTGNTRYVEHEIDENDSIQPIYLQYAYQPVLSADGKVYEISDYSGNELFINTQNGEFIATDKNSEIFHNYTNFINEYKYITYSNMENDITISDYSKSLMQYTILDHIDCQGIKVSNDNCVAAVLNSYGEIFLLSLENDIKSEQYSGVDFEDYFQHINEDYHDTTKQITIAVSQDKEYKLVDVLSEEKPEHWTGNVYESPSAQELYESIWVADSEGKLLYNAFIPKQCIALDIQDEEIACGLMYDLTLCIINMKTGETIRSTSRINFNEDCALTINHHIRYHVVELDVDFENNLAMVGIDGFHDYIRSMYSLETGKLLCDYTQIIRDTDLNADMVEKQIFIEEDTPNVIVYHIPEYSQIENELLDDLRGRVLTEEEFLHYQLGNIKDYVKVKKKLQKKIDNHIYDTQRIIHEHELGYVDITMKEGDRLSVSSIWANESDDKNVNWYSLNENIALIRGNELIAVQEGNTVITAVSDQKITEYHVQITIKYAEDFQWKFDQGTLTISGQGRMPEDIALNQLPWQDYIHHINKVIIEEGITAISYYTFEDCINLTSVSLPSSLVTIEEGAFCNCRSLYEIHLPDTILNLGNAIFLKCENLKYVNIPINTRSIANRMFSNCTSLAEIEIPESVREIGDSAFRGCESLIEVRLPISITSIGASAFYGCKRLSGIIIPDAVTYIGNEAFMRCERLLSVKLPPEITMIERFTFYECRNLIEISIPEGVTTIGLYAFNSCMSLKEIVLPESVTIVENGAFSNCNGINSFFIPRTVESIGKNVWMGCNRLQRIIVDTGNPYYHIYNDALISKDGTELLAYPIGKKNTEFVIPDGVISLDSKFFEGDSEIITIKIPESITMISYDAFNGCTSLREIIIDPNNLIYADINGVLTDRKRTRLFYYPKGRLEEKYIIPDGILIIEKSAFENCHNLKEVSLSGSVTEINDYAFKGCDSLANINFTEELEIIKVGAFEECTKLSMIELPNGIETIERNAFYQCSNLKEITIPVSVIQLDTQSFKECIALEGIHINENNTRYSSVEGVVFNKEKTELLIFPSGYKTTNYIIPEGVLTIEPWTIEDCENIKQITFPSSMKQIGKCIIWDCINLSQVILPEGTEVIGEYGSHIVGGDAKSFISYLVAEANQYFTSVNGVLFNKEKTILLHYPEGRSEEVYEVPSGVKEIGWFAFRKARMKEIIIPDTVITINSNAFESSNLQSILIPNSVVDIGDRIISNCVSLENVYCPGNPERPERWDKRCFINSNANIIWGK